MINKEQGMALVTITVDTDTLRDMRMALLRARKVCQDLDRYEEAEAYRAIYLSLLDAQYPADAKFRDEQGKIEQTDKEQQ